MISVGIDVSKGKSTICILKPYGEIVRSPFDVQHTNSGLESLVQILEGLDEEFRIAMEATGAYHYPILYYLKEKLNRSGLYKRYTHRSGVKMKSNGKATFYEL